MSTFLTLFVCLFICFGIGIGLGLELRTPRRVNVESIKQGNCQQKTRKNNNNNRGNSNNNNLSWLNPSSFVLFFLMIFYYSFQFVPVCVCRWVSVCIVCVCKSFKGIFFIRAKPPAVCPLFPSEKVSESFCPAPATVRSFGSFIRLSCGPRAHQKLANGCFWQALGSDFSSEHLLAHLAPSSMPLFDFWSGVEYSAWACHKHDKVSRTFFDS